jgi:Zn-dependent peptidase ImmA (M78 family)/transcriptional regulator with XRE-family HTH domain
VAPRIEAIINPELLVWARDSASLSVEDAAKKAHVRPELLDEWESGVARPTVNQLRLLAEAYKRPLAVFYLPKPPKSFDALRDFRGTRATAKESPALAYEIRRAHERREIARDLLDELGEPTSAAKLAAPTTDPPDKVAMALRAVLGVTLAHQRQWNSEYAAFASWRDAIEDSGIFVFQTTGVPVGEARGFSISIQPLPVIAMNGKDSYAGRIFTMMHELAHLALREGGICDLDEHGLEVFCNAVAGSLLVPSEALLADSEVRESSKPGSWPEETIQRLAREFRVSREVIVRRLLTVGKTTSSFYDRKRRAYAAEPKRPPPAGGPPPPALTMARAGKFFTGVVVRSYAEGRITSADASDFLSLKLRHLPEVMRALRVGLTA